MATIVKALNEDKKLIYLYFKEIVLKFLTKN